MKNILRIQKTSEEPTYSNLPKIWLVLSTCLDMHLREIPHRLVTYIIGKTSKNTALSPGQDEIIVGRQFRAPYLHFATPVRCLQSETSWHFKQVDSWNGRQRVWTSWSLTYLKLRTFEEREELRQLRSLLDDELVLCGAFQPPRWSGDAQEVQTQLIASVRRKD